MSNYSRVKTYLAPLKIYRKLEGNLLVKQKYTVPVNSSWPEQFHNMNLGTAVNYIRQDIKKSKVSQHDLIELVRIDFIPDIKKYLADRALLGFQEYKRVMGNCDLSTKYVVPKSSQWAKEVHGLNLGFILDNMRQKSYHESIRDKVTELGFNLVATEINAVGFPTILSALVAYKAIHGDVDIVKDFIVPSGDARYPENTWGMNLGINLHNIRCKGAWSEHSAQLEALGVNYEVRPMRRESFDVIYSALESFTAVHGHVKVPQKFVVPSDTNYPENTWEMKLGFIVRDIRNKGNYVAEHKEQLVAIGLIAAV